MADEKKINAIEEYMYVTRLNEAPNSYHWWGAVSLITSILRDNVWYYFASRRETICPNMYIILHSEGSSETRKSAPLNINNKLLRQVKNTKIWSGSGTMEAVLKGLGSTTSEKGTPQGGSGIVIAKELSAFFLLNQTTINTLTDIYEFADEWDKSLATYDIPVIKRLCFSIFGGTNDSMMKQMFDEKAMEGGLLARTVLIMEKEKRQSKSGFEIDDPIILDDDWKPLIKFLNELKNISRGPVIFTDHAYARMHEWYIDYDKNVVKTFDTKTGFEHRLQTHVIKLSMALAAAENPRWNRYVGLEHINKAIEVMLGVARKYRKLTMGAGIAITTSAATLIIRSLLKTKSRSMTKIDLMHRNVGQLDLLNMAPALDTLLAQEFITEINIQGVPGIQITQKCIDFIMMSPNGQKTFTAES